MHNRVRRVAASFLVKHLLIASQEGAAWFWDTLVDADLANNTLGWQWVAGCGADAAPYFRIFNPVLQGEKFDPAGNYVRRWIPELARLPDAWIHKPWRAPRSILSNAGVELGKTYPYPIVDHDEARRRALGALRNLNATLSLPRAPSARHAHASLPGSHPPTAAIRELAGGGPLGRSTLNHGPIHPCLLVQPSRSPQNRPMHQFLIIGILVGEAVVPQLNVHNP